MNQVTYDYDHMHHCPTCDSWWEHDDDSCDETQEDYCEKCWESYNGVSI